MTGGTIDYHNDKPRCRQGRQIWHHVPSGQLSVFSVLTVLYQRKINTCSVAGQYLEAELKNLDTYKRFLLGMCQPISTHTMPNCPLLPGGPGAQLYRITTLHLQFNFAADIVLPSPDLLHRDRHTFCTCYSNCVVGACAKVCYNFIMNQTQQNHDDVVKWASYLIRKIAGCACAGNAGNVFPRRRFQRKPLVSDPGMHHGTCVTHVPWCMSGSLTCGDGENVPGACAPAILRIWQEAHGNAFRVTGHLCGEFTGHRWIPRSKASDAELWCFLWSAPE